MSVETARNPYELMGSSELIRDAAAQVWRAAADDRGVLVTAEAGLDAHALALAVHQGSPRKFGPFIVLACGGSPAGELGRKLFGTAARAAGADLDLIGATALLLRAQGGTLFLDGISELPAPLQRRLARVLQDGEIRVARRAGAVALDVRIVASQEPGLNGSVRDDLLRRLPLRLEVPTLRQRREDVGAIAEAMLAARDPLRKFTPAAITVLAALPWRRNTIELAGLIDRLSATGSTTLIRQEDVLAEVHLDRPAVRASGSLKEARRQFEREYIASVLRDHEWHMPEAARALGIERANLYRKARQLGIPLRRDADSARMTR